MKITKQIIKTTKVNCAGVYAISDENGTVLYIGSGIELGDRLTNHRWNLEKGKYANTRKKYVLQDIFDNGILYFTVLHESVHSNDEIKHMTKKEKTDLEKALSVLEQLYIEMYKDTACNTQRTVNRSSGYSTKVSTMNRRILNIGSHNPNCKYTEDLITNVIYLKNKGLKAGKIVELLNDIDVHMSQSYIYNIGKMRWTDLQGKKPGWYTE